MISFNRTASLVIGSELLGLRVVFDIEKEMTANGASKCEIKIYNLSQAHLNEIEQGTQNQQLVLSAGYNGLNKMLYSGPIFYAHTELSGPDSVTTCQMLPGAIALGTVFVKVAGANTAWDVYRAVVNAFKPYGVAQGHLSAGVQQAFQSSKYQARYSDVDTAAGLMDKITRWAGLRWNTVDNQLNVYSDNEYQDSEIILLNKDTGMIGIPSKTQEGNYKVKALLNGDIVPGKRVRVQSLRFPVSGDLRVLKTTHSGDSHPLDPGADWYVELEGAVLGTAPGFTEAG